MKRFINYIFLLTVLVFSTAGNAISATEDLSKKELIIHQESASVENHDIKYSWVGEGKDILLLHGMFGSKEQWQDLMKLLAERNYHVIAVDLPGYGKSLGFPESDYDLARQVELLHEFVKQINLQKFNIAGNSMGGAVAALYTIKFTEQITSLAFIGGPFGVKTPIPSEADKLLASGKNPFVPLTKEEFVEEMKLLFTDPPQFSDEKIEKRLMRYRQDKAQDLRIWEKAQPYHSIFNKNFDIKIPTLIIWGDKDNAINISGAEIVKNNIKGSTLITIPNGSHLLFMENPKLTDEYYSEFLNKNN